MTVDNNKKEPAEWRPIDIDKFAEERKKFSEVFNSDPERASGPENKKDIEHKDE